MLTEKALIVSAQNWRSTLTHLENIKKTEKQECWYNYWYVVNDDNNFLSWLLLCWIWLWLAFKWVSDESSQTESANDCFTDAELMKIINLSWSHFIFQSAKTVISAMMNECHRNVNTIEAVEISWLDMHQKLMFEEMINVKYFIHCEKENADERFRTVNNDLSDNIAAFSSKKTMKRKKRKKSSWLFH